MKSILRIINNNHHHFFLFYKGGYRGKVFFLFTFPHSPLVDALEDVRYFVRFDVRVRNRKRIFDGFECLGDGRRL